MISELVNIYSNVFVKLIYILMCLFIDVVCSEGVLFYFIAFCSLAIDNPNSLYHTCDTFLSYD